ncbi:Rieske 2Fe-2S domain-containing protein [Parahaliea mediterranea]|uniref:Rieske 2Fe-2S domain-containing protein n=1 Tax=Parahaliea mediterranea TaxID=651086 RepID=UPI000E2E4617|nr:Rieske 2Fe-2S domain-containing protein [Parahaliea mediterranea]
MATTKEYALGPAAFPRGWFVIASSQSLTRKPLALRFWGRDLALYRGESGRAILMDAYCPHMGTHLAASESAALASSGLQIEGDTIRCPYHGWRFNADGECDDIPYLDGRCPKSARIRTYPVVEQLGCIMAWYDDNAEPPLFSAPQLPEWDQPRWIQWTLDDCGEMAVHPQEILDNMADVRHLGPTHGAPCEIYENEFQGHYYIQRQGGYHHDYNAFLETITWYTGPGILLSRQAFAGTQTVQFIATTPVDDGVIHAWHGLLFDAGHDTPTVKDKARAQQAQQEALNALAADFSVWRNKRPALKIMQVKTDGPFDKGRQWHQQFYANRPDVEGIQAAIDGVHRVTGLPAPAPDFPSFGRAGYPPAPKAFGKARAI